MLGPRGERRLRPRGSADTEGTKPGGLGTAGLTVLPEAGLWPGDAGVTPLWTEGPQGISLRDSVTGALTLEFVEPQVDLLPNRVSCLLCQRRCLLHFPSEIL